MLNVSWFISSVRTNEYRAKDFVAEEELKYYNITEETKALNNKIEKEISDLDGKIINLDSEFNKLKEGLDKNALKVPIPSNDCKYTEITEVCDKPQINCKLCPNKFLTKSELKSAS